MSATESLNKAQPLQYDEEWGSASYTSTDIFQTNLPKIRLLKSFPWPVALNSSASKGQLLLLLESRGRTRRSCFSLTYCPQKAQFLHAKLKSMNDFSGTPNWVCIRMARTFILGLNSQTHVKTRYDRSYVGGLTTL